VAKAHVEPGSEAAQHLIFMKNVYTTKTILIKIRCWTVIPLNLT